MKRWQKVIELKKRIEDDEDEERKTFTPFFIGRTYGRRRPASSIPAVSHLHVQQRRSSKYAQIRKRKMTFMQFPGQYGYHLAPDEFDKGLSKVKNLRFTIVPGEPTNSEGELMEDRAYYGSWMIARDRLHKHELVKKGHFKLRFRAEGATRKSSSLLLNPLLL